MKPWDCTRTWPKPAGRCVSAAPAQAQPNLGPGSGAAGTPRPALGPPALCGRTRRDALKQLSAGVLLSLGLWPGALQARAKSGSRPFRFIVVNDIHYMSDACGTWLEGVVQQMRREAPEFCLLAGDLTEHGRREHLAAVRDVFAGLRVPTYVQIGNHDYLQDSAGFAAAAPAAPALRSPRAAAGKREDAAAPRGLGLAYSPGDRRFYEELFPGRLNYTFDHNGWQFLGLDSSEGLWYQNTEIQPPTLRWLDDHLGKLDPSKPTVVFTHFPLGAGVTYRPANADDLLERLGGFNLRAVFSGHFHGFTERRAGPVALTTNQCCALKRSNHDGTKERGYFVCTAGNGEVTRRFVECKLPASVGTQ